MRKAVAQAFAEMVGRVKRVAAREFQVEVEIVLEGEAKAMLELADA